MTINGWAWRRVGGLAIALFSSGVGSAVNAGVVYSLNGSTPAAIPGGNIIPVGDIAAGTTSDLRIWDDDGSGHDDSIGMITVTGRSLAGMGGTPDGRLRVSTVSGGGDGYFFFSNHPVGPGLRDLGGIQFQDSSGGGTTLRDHAVVAATIQGDLTGDIDAAQIYRIDAWRYDVSGSFAGGRILGNLTARRANFSVADNDLSSKSIAYVRAERKIEGSITAESPTFDFAVPSTHADIGFVVVDSPDHSDEDIDGVVGDVKALNGRIQKLWSNGPIGRSAGTLTKVYAALGIDEMRTAPESSSLPVTTANIRADIQASIGYSVQLLPGSEMYRAEDDAAIYLVESGGAIDGSITAKNVTYNENALGTHSGIIARGPINAPIDIELNLENADIVGSSINGAVAIGVKAKGSIIASDEASGHIGTVSIGRGTTSDANAYAEFFPRGLCGNNGTPWSPSATSPTDVFNADDWYPDSGSYVCRDGGCIDSVIRAQTISAIDLASMTLTYRADTTGFEFTKWFAPRIESPSIGVLHVTDLRNGVIWSGALDQNLSGSNDPADDFASIGALTISCAGWGGKLWLNGNNDVTVTGDMLGEIHFPTLAAGPTVRIDGKFGDWTDTCGCETIGTACLFATPAQTDGCNSNQQWHEGSPRDVLADSTEEIGLIRIHDEAGLEGQIIINGDVATSGASVLWKGYVAVGDKIIGPSPSDTDLESPYYTRASADLGGGSVGLAPYSLHGEDCHPPHNHLGRADGVSQRDFEDPNTIAVWAQSYGPMVIPEGGSLTDYVYILVQDPADPCGWLDMTGMFTLVLHPDLNLNNQTDPDELRYIGLKKNGHIPLPGIYRLVNWLACDGLDLPYDVMLDWPVWTPPPGTCTPYALEPSYVFRIWPDCDDDGLNDLIEIDNDTSGTLDADHDDVLDSCEDSCHICDVNQSGAVTVQDIFDFLFAYFQGSACIGPVPNTSCANASPASSCEVSSGGSTVAVDADVNDSCSVTVQDIFDFLACYFASTGDCP